MPTRLEFVVNGNNFTMNPVDAQPGQQVVETVSDRPHHHQRENSPLYSSDTHKFVDGLVVKIRRESVGIGEEQVRAKYKVESMRGKRQLRQCGFHIATRVSAVIANE